MATPDMLVLLQCKLQCHVGVCGYKPGPGLKGCEQRSSGNHSSTGVCSYRDYSYTGRMQGIVA